MISLTITSPNCQCDVDVLEVPVIACHR